MKKAKKDLVLMIKVRLHPLIVLLLMIVMSFITLFASTAIYVARILGSTLLLLLHAGDKFCKWAAGYLILWALVLLCRSGYSTDPLLGSFYAMFLIIIKLYPILMLAAVLAQYTSVELMRCIDRVGCPRSLSLALAVVIRFLPVLRRAQ